MLRFIIDGYNLLNKIPRPKGLSLRGQRQFLVSFLETFKAGMSQRNQVLVVFDGKSRFSFDQEPQGRIKILFSRDEDADTLIKRIVDEDADVKSLVVVSDDKEIVLYARARGAGFKGSSEFLQRVSRANKKRPKVVRDDHNKLDFRKVDKVNQEIKGLWQKKYL